MAGYPPLPLLTLSLLPTAWEGYADTVYPILFLVFVEYLSRKFCWEFMPYAYLRLVGGPKPPPGDLREVASSAVTPLWAALGLALFLLIF